jgi:hypothetical protein
MANFTITNSTFTYNSSALAGFVNNDLIFLRNSNLIIDSDNRWGYNGSVFSRLVIEGAYGGSILIDGRNVWEIPFSSSSGTVPILSAIENTPESIGTTSGAYGKLLGVWNNTDYEPISSTNGNIKPLPSSGWIKLKSKTGNFIPNEQIQLSNGSTITISSSGKRSWINVVGKAGGYYDHQTTIGTLSTKGDWYYLNETTNGQYNQVIKVPVKDNINGVWIETNPNSEQYMPWHNAATSWGLLNVTNVLSSGFIYGELSANGRIFNSSLENGTITIAYSGVDGKFGYLPPANCKIRVPNIFLSSSGNGTGTPTASAATGSYSQNIVANSYDDMFYRRSGTRTANFENCNSNWSYNANGAGIDFILRNSAVHAKMNYGATDNIVIDNVIASPYKGYTAYNYDNSTSCLAIYNAKNCKLNNVSILAVNGSTYGVLGNSSVPFYINDCENIEIKNCFSMIPNAGRELRYNIQVARNTGTFLIQNFSYLGAHGMSLTNTNNTTIYNTKGKQFVNGILDVTATGRILFNLNNCNNTFIDGVYQLTELNNSVKNSSGIPTGDPSITLYAYNLTNNVELRNVGTQTNPLTSFSASTNNGSFGVLDIYDATNIKIRNMHIVARKLIADIGTSGQSKGTLADTILMENCYLYPSSFGRSGEIPNYKNCTIRGTLVAAVTGNTSIPQGDVGGVHFKDIFYSDSNGLLYLMANVPTDLTSNYVAVDLIPNGTNKSGFLGDSMITLCNVGDSITWEMPYYMLGHTGFRNVQPTIRGTNVTNLSAAFQYDNTKNGYNNNWLTLNAQNLSAISIDPTIGIKMKIRVTSTANVVNTIFNYLYIETNTNSISQQIRYPLPKTNKGTITNLITNSRVQIYNETTGQELYNVIHQESGDLIYDYNNGEEISIGDIIRIRVTYINGTTAKLRHEVKAVASPTGFTAFADQEDDVIYNLHAINGSTITEFTADYPTIQVDINDPDQTTSIPRLYAWWVANEYTEQGIRNYYEGLIAEDVANYKIITDVVDLKLDNTRNVGVVFEGDYRLYRDDGDIPIVTTTSGGGSVILYAGRVNITRVETGVSGLTEEESDTLLKINTIPQDTFSLKLSSITEDETIGMRLKSSATVSNVSQILSDTLSI